MMHRPLNIYRGELSETRKKFWRLARWKGDSEPLNRLQSPAGILLWGHPVSKLVIAFALALVFSALAWGLPGARFDGEYWPLWLAAAISLLVLLSGFFLVERFSLDANRRCWCYQRGWRGRPREESGGYEDLSGLVLEKYRYGEIQQRVLYAVVLEFADGYRFFRASFGFSSLETARGEAERLAKASGLPLTERLDT